MFGELFEDMFAMAFSFVKKVIATALILFIICLVLPKMLEFIKGDCTDIKKNVTNVWCIGIDFFIGLTLYKGFSTLTPYITRAKNALAKTALGEKIGLKVIEETPNAETANIAKGGEVISNEEKVAQEFLSEL